MTGKYSRGTAAFLAAVVCLLLCACGSGVSGKAQEWSESAMSAASSAENRTDTEQLADPMGRLAGTYYIDGDSSAACVVIGEDGSFTAYYASGSVEQKGAVRYEKEGTGDDALNVYVFYTDDGKPYMGFADSGEPKISEFETGNGSVRYVRQAE